MTKPRRIGDIVTTPDGARRVVACWAVVSPYTGPNKQTRTTGWAYGLAPLNNEKERP